MKKRPAHDRIASLTLEQITLMSAKVYINGKEIRTAKEMEEALKKLEVKEDDERL